jgi:predicted ester cyclase
VDVRQVHERLASAFNSKDEEGVRNAVSDDIEFLLPGVRLVGKDAYIEMARMYWNAFPDFSVNVAAIHVDGDTVVEEGTFTATHTGLLVGPDSEIPATGRRIDLPYIDCFTIRGDKVSSDRLIFDRLIMLEQLGLLPQPAGATG